MALSPISSDISLIPPAIVIVGSTNRAVDEFKARLRGALTNSNLLTPCNRITINLAPADVPKNGSSFDPAIAAILVTSGQVNYKFSETEALLGEQGLDCSLHPLRGIIGKLLAGRAKGIATFYIPEANLRQAQLVPDVTLIPVSQLA